MMTEPSSKALDDWLDNGQRSATKSLELELSKAAKTDEVLWCLSVLRTEAALRLTPTYLKETAKYYDACECAPARL